MKKKVLWMAVLLATVGAGTASADWVQQSEKFYNWVNKSAVGPALSKASGQIVPGAKLKGQTFTLTNITPDQRNITFLRKRYQDANRDSTAEIIRQYNATGFIMLEDEDLISFKRGGATIEVWTGSGIGLYTTYGDTTIAVYREKSNVTLEVRKGTLYQTKSARVDALMCFVSSVDEGKIQRQVNGLKKSGQSPDDLAARIIDTKSKKAGFISAVAGLAGPFAVPAGAVEMFGQWIIQAEMAYAIAYAYDYKRSPEAFLIDLYVLFGDDSGAKSAINTATKVSPKAVTVSTVNSAASQASDKLIPELAGKLTSKVGKKATSQLMQTISVVSSVVNTAAAFEDAVNFGEKAKKYYKN